MRTVILLTFFLFCIKTIAQQITKPLQFQFNLANSNPAFVGVNKALTVSSFVNNRPSNSYINTSYKSLQADVPFRFYSMGIGLSAEQSKISTNELTRIKLSYSYKIRLLEGLLSFGTGMGINQYSTNLDQQNIRHLTDPTITQNATLIKPLINTGIFFKNKRVSMSASIDNILRNQLSKNAPTSYSKSARNLILFTETNHRLTDNLLLKPSIQIIHTKDIPLNITPSLLLDINEKAWCSISYRIWAETYFSGGINLERLIPGFSQPIKLGVAYAILQNHGVNLNNSFEVFISYSYMKRPNPEKIKNQKRIVSPIIFN